MNVESQQYDFVLEKCFVPSKALMFRVASMFLAIAVIMACPFHCMANVGGPDAPAQQEAVCSCCGHGGPAEDPAPRRDPLTPGGDCGCGSCLCHGAVVESAQATIDLEFAGNGFFSANLPLKTRGLSFDIPNRPDWFSDRAPSPPAGRAARILHQSFLL